MKNTTFIIIVVIGVIGLFVIIYSSGSPRNDLVVEPPRITNSPTEFPTVIHTVVPEIIPPSQPTVSITPRSSAELADNIDFVLDPGIPESCGLTCRKTTATITNWGNATAHNVCVWLNVRNGNDEIIYLNGFSGVHTCIGDLGSGLPVSEDMTLEADCGALALKCVGQELIMSASITSTEKTVYFHDQHFD